LAAWLGISGLVFGGVLQGEGAGVDYLNPQIAPEVFGGNSFFGPINNDALDFIQAVQGQLASSLTVGAVFIGWNGVAAQATEALGLTNGLPAGGAGLGDLPKKGPEDQAQGPSALAGMRASVFLGEAEMADPGAEDGFQLMKGLAGPLAEAAAFGVKTSGPQRKIWRQHGTVHTLS
jgi:hypothetical protein